MCAQTIKIEVRNFPRGACPQTPYFKNVNELYKFLPNKKPFEVLIQSSPSLDENPK